MNHIGSETTSMYKTKISFHFLPREHSQEKWLLSQCLCEAKNQEHIGSEAVYSSAKFR
jgi:hypothetical protein